MGEESSSTPPDSSTSQSVLKIEGVELKDRAQYICRTKYSDGNETNIFYLRVRDPKSGWYAVIGMVGEAILIILVIFFADFCKEHRSRREANKRERVNPTTDGCTDVQMEDVPLMKSDDKPSTARVST